MILNFTKVCKALNATVEHIPAPYSYSYSSQLTITNRLPLCQETKYFRDFSHFDKHLFLNDLENIDFNQLINEDVNKSINNVINALQTLSDKHAPVKTIEQKK